MLLPCGDSWEAMAKPILILGKLSPQPSSLTPAGSSSRKKPEAEVLEAQEVCRPVLLRHEDTSASPEGLWKQIARPHPQTLGA